MACGTKRHLRKWTAINLFRLGTGYFGEPPFRHDTGCSAIVRLLR
jgi:hypothetical protein